MSILEVNEIHTFYGTSHILFGISLAVNEGELVSLLGRNGAGKTTTLRSIMGLTSIHHGSIQFRGEEIGRKPAFFIAKRGIGYVPDERLIFPDLTVWENLDIASKKPKGRGQEWTKERVYELFPVLKEMEKRLGGALSGGQQQMLTLARTLMTNPLMLLLDEPAEGLAPLVVKMLSEKIQGLKEQGMSILLSEQNVKFAMRLSDRAYVIEKGLIRYHGGIKELEENVEVKRKYLMV
jgi:branched-chain amino acid transport system ATP-binding protein